MTSFDDHVELRETIHALAGRELQGELGPELQGELAALLDESADARAARRSIRIPSECPGTRVCYASW